MCESTYIIDPFLEKLIIVVISAIGGAVCTYLGAVKITKKNKRIEAGFKLYDSFRETLRSLEKADNFDTQDILHRAFGEQMRAAEQFKFFLPDRTRKGFSAAWNKYKEKCSKSKYADQGVKAEREPYRKAALEDIYKILEFTEYRQYTFLEKIKILWNKIKRKIKKTAQHL